MRRRIPLPEALVARAREYADGARTPVEPRDAATVILLRSGAAGAEVYLLRRQKSMAFASGMCVFPGGAVDPRDFDDDLAWAGPVAEEWAVRLGTEPPLARALVCAAARETFEESGVLLAGSDPESVVADTTSDDWEADRRALESREVSLTELLTRRGLVLRSDLLQPWDAWLTPAFEPRRYRTWFFVAELPAGQVTRDVSSESADAHWMAPADAVRAVDAGGLFMMPPTYLNCLEVSGLGSAAAVIADAESRRLEMFMPDLQETPDGVVLSHPARLDALLSDGDP